MTQMRIADITVGERRREDMGDIAGLAASIDKYGLIHAIVVDPNGRLVVGGRRLAACESLGMTWVEIRQWDELTEAELREIELEENLRRKDLTPYEASRQIIDKAADAVDVIGRNSVQLENHQVALALASECSDRFGTAPFVPELAGLLELA